MAEDTDRKRHPDTTYAAQYPYSKTMTTESGHGWEYDDTPGNERTRYFHSIGSYEEVSPNGRRVTVTVNNQVIYTKGGLTISVDQNGDVKIGGHARINITGDCHLEVGGSVTAAVGGDMMAHVIGTSFSRTEGTSVLSAKNMHIEVDENLNIKANNIYTTAKSDLILASNTYTRAVQQDSSVTVAGDVMEVYFKNHNTQVLGNRDLDVVGTFLVHSKSSMTLNSDDTFLANSALKMVLNTATVFNANAASNMTLKGTPINLNP